MKRILIFTAILTIGVVAFAAATRSYYCVYCGYKTNSVSTLTAGKCLRHPNGSLKGNHVLYEGSEKDEYICKYCGHKSSSIRVLTAGKCLRHPIGSLKGYHSPSL